MGGFRTVRFSKRHVMAHRCLASSSKWLFADSLGYMARALHFVAAEAAHAHLIVKLDISVTDDRLPSGLVTV